MLHLRSAGLCAGYLDGDSFVLITDRKKDVVLVKGFNVFPRESKR
jgi:acyl-CoA synthetase (AMP-forming)/AMP-acid ligase II